MNSAHYLSSTYLKILVQANQSLINTLEIALGYAITDLLKKRFIGGRDVDHIFHLFHSHGLDSWILRYGNHVGITSHGPLAFAVLSAPNLQTAIEVAAEYTSTRLSFFDCEIVQYKNRTQYVFKSKTDNALSERWLVESGMHVVKQMIETIIAHPAGDNAKITFTYPEPDYRQELEAFYGLRCEFNQGQNSISIPSSWGQISSPLSDQASFKSNVRKCQELKATLDGEQTLLDDARMALNLFFERSSDDTEMPSLTSLAASQHMSPRTYTRRLSEQGYHYKKLVDQSRQQHAQELLQHTHHSVADIALQLGYQESANFIRAFQRWHQVTPTQWRKKQK